MKQTLSQELNENVQVLEEMIECYDDVVDLALEKILKTIKILRGENLELALDLSRVYQGESFWNKRVQTFRNAL